MAGSLIKLQETIISSSTSSVTLGDTYWDSSYDVYMVRINALVPASDSNLSARFTVSGTPDTSSNYDRAAYDLRSDVNFANITIANQNNIQLASTGSATNEMGNGIFYLFNFNNASEYSFMTNEESTIHPTNGAVRGRQGGAVLTVAQATDGIQFFMASGNINSGQFVLYGLKK